MRILLLLLLLAITALASSPPEEFFRSLDRDADGDVDKDELARAIFEANRGALGSSTISGSSNGEEEAMRKGLAHAFGKQTDDALLHSDLVSHWLAMASLQSPERVGEWLEHSIELPREICDKFVRANFTGLDLPSLLTSKGEEQVLKALNVVLTRQQRIKLLGAIKLRMLRAGQVPPPPQLRALPNTRCGVILSWENAPLPSPASPEQLATFPEVHKYILYRRLARDDDLPENPWGIVYQGLARSFSDRPPPLPQHGNEQLFDYKIEAWNLMGKNQAVELHDVRCARCNVEGMAASSFWLQWVWVLISVLQEFKPVLVSVANAVVALGAMYAYYSRAQRAEEELEEKALLSEQQEAAAATSPILREASVSVHEYAIQQQQQHIAVMAQKSLVRTRIDLNKCGQCGRSVTRSTRHHCGQCMRVFCVAHTAIQPHLVMGGTVLTACGVNSKCRCYGCCSNNNGNNGEQGGGEETTMGSGRRDSWRLVKDRVLISKTLRIWKRPPPPSHQGGGNED